MPKTPKPHALADLDAEVARATFFDVTVDWVDPLDRGLTMQLEVAESDAGVRGFVAVVDAVRAGERDARGRPMVDRWRKRAPRLSTVLKAFAKERPDVELPPRRLAVSCRGAGLSPAPVAQLLLEGFAEALGRPLPVAPTPAGDPAAEAVDWPALLRSGREGLRRWGKLKAAERKAVNLSGADLGGLDLGGMNLVGVEARKARFSGSTLAKANLSGAQLDGADFSNADLRDARLTNVRAPGSAFRGASLVGSVLGDAMLFGCDFDGADLRDARLAAANLHRAALAGARLDGVDLDGASFDDGTTWPAGFAIPAEALFAGKGTDPRLVGRGKSAVAVDFNGLMARLQGLIDPKRMRRTLDMLKAGRNQLYAEAEPDAVRGVVRSQSAEDVVYSCTIGADGVYACATPDLSPCMGLCGEPCKHLLVLLIGLCRAGRLDPATVDRWVVAAAGKKHKWNDRTKGLVADTLLMYKGVQAGEVDWRPTETIPEDFYAM